MDSHKLLQKFLKTGYSPFSRRNMTHKTSAVKHDPAVLRLTDSISGQSGNFMLLKFLWILIHEYLSCDRMYTFKIVIAKSHTNSRKKSINSSNSSAYFSRNSSNYNTNSIHDYKTYTFRLWLGSVHILIRNSSAKSSNNCDWSSSCRNPSSLKKKSSISDRSSTSFSRKFSKHWLEIPQIAIKKSSNLCWEFCKL